MKSWPFQTGIVVMIFWQDHGVPHFHVRYGGETASIAIETLALIEGRVPARVLGLVVEWAALHRAELMANWEHARRAEQLVPIAPLE